MPEVTATQVKDLRDKTGAGMMDCKRALTETAGDFERAIDWLRQKGLAAAQKKASRAASEGMIGHYVHLGGKIGVLVEVNCETDFVAKNELFQAFVKDIAMQIAGHSPAPEHVRREEVPAERLEREKDVFRAQLKEQGKPEKIWDKIIAGKVDKFHKDICLLEQDWIKDPEKTVQQLLNETIAKIGENIQVRRFARFVLGEGIEKKKADLAADVAATISAAAQ